jgi:Taurine catabolism dioxygenase TauD, TfdA family/Gamma-butyrobetaine hydroxylase-like, N-terminal
MSGIVLAAATNSIAAAPRLGKTGLFVPLQGVEVYFNYYWLRDACPSAIDRQTRERVFDISALPAPLRASTAKVENDVLHIVWAQEDHKTELPLAMLAAHNAGGIANDPADLPRKQWYGDQYPMFARFPQREIEHNQSVRARFARALIEDGIALVTGMENSDDSLTRLVHTLGPVTPSVDGLYFDVRLEVEPSNLAFTAKALELHTDLPSEEAAPGIQFLHCRENTVEGGESLFVDGASVAEELRLIRPEDFELLASHEIPFFRRHANWHYKSYQRVIELDRLGEVSGLTVSQHLQDNIDLPQHLLDLYYPAYIRFINMLKEQRFVSRFRLNAGECIVFDNHRIVHGREAYSAHSGRRHLRGCYTDRAAMRSTYRVLASQGCLIDPVNG